MSEKKTSAIPLSTSRPPPSMLAQFFGVGETEEVRKESAIARTGPGRASNGQRAQSRGPAKAKKAGKGKVWPQTTKAADSCKTDKLMVSTSDYSRLLATGKPLSLKEFSKRKSVRDLPCLVKVVAGGHLRLCEVCDHDFGQEQMVVVLEKKSMRVVTCKDHMDGSSYAVPLHTTFFHLVPYWMDAERIHPNSFGRITANELLQSKALPLVFAVSVEFEVGEHHSKKTVPIGTLLFPNQKKRSKDWRQGVLRTKSESGEMVLITPDCNGRFSILACDVRLSLQQAITHLKPPFTMQTFSDCDTLYVDVVTVTVERVHKEEVLIGMMKTTEGATRDDAAAYSRMVELPVSLTLTVVTMVPKQQEMLYQVYDFVLAKYCGGMRQTAKLSSSPAGRVAVASRPVHLGSPGKLTAQSSPSTPVLPSTTLQLSVATPNRNKHRQFLANQQMASPHPTVGGIEDDQPPYDYDVIDYYEPMPTPASQQMASPHPTVGGIEDDQPPNDYDVIDYYEPMPTPASQQMASPHPTVGGIDDDQPPYDYARIDYYEAMPAPANQQLASPCPTAGGIEDDQPPNDYDVIDYYEPMPTPASQQMASPHPTLGGIDDDQPPYDYARIDYYEAMPTPANQQMAPPRPTSGGIEDDQTPNDDADKDYYEAMLTPANQQMAPPRPTAGGIEDDQTPNDDADKDYYEAMPTPANQQMAPPHSTVGGIEDDQLQQEDTLDHIYDIAHSDCYNNVLCRPVKSHSMCADDGLIMAPNPAYIEVSMATAYNMKATHLYISGP